MTKHFPSEIGPFYTRLLGVVIRDFQHAEERPTLSERQGDMIDTDTPPSGIGFLPLPFVMILEHLQTFVISFYKPRSEFCRWHLSNESNRLNYRLQPLRLLRKVMEI